MPVDGVRKIRVSAAVINWNNRETILACLESLLSQEEVDLDPVVMDNGSRDGSDELVRKRFPELRLIANSDNLGFAAAHNIGYQNTQGDWHLVLNSDVVLRPDYLRRLLEVGESDPRIGALSGKLLRFESRHSKGVIDSAGIEMFASRRVWDRGTGETDVGQFDRTEDVFGCCAAAAVYRRAMLQELATDGRIFPEVYFAYYEDVDLAWRMGEAGWRSIYVSCAIGRHVRGGSTRGSRVTRELVFRNRYVLLVRNDRIRDLLAHLVPVLAIELLQLLRLVCYPHLWKSLPRLSRSLKMALRERVAMKRHGRRFGLGPLRRFVVKGAGIRGWFGAAKT